MATNMYVKFEPELKGESTDASHPEWLEILSWNHGFSQPTSPIRSSAGGGTVERANHQDLNFTKYVDSATDDILKKLWAGETLTKATLECFRSDGATDAAPVKYLLIEMEKVIISNYSISGGPGDVPVENISLSYGKVTYTYNPQKEDTGKAEGAQPVFHDLITNAIG